MIELELNRVYKKEKYTIGKLYVNGKYFSDTIEDKVRILNSFEDKVYGETAIPQGRYKVLVTYSPRFKRYLPELINTPFFKNIRIHSGNTEKDSEGCIIVGENKVKGKVINSRATLDKLMDILLPAAQRGEEIFITIC